ncbi:MAG: hypothetical protein V9E94_02605 [Microthrixaceae bacterium]
MRPGSVVAVQLLRQVVLHADVVDHAELRLDPVEVGLLVGEAVLEQFACAVVARWLTASSMPRL